jgi:hypothetical protein
MPWQDVRIPEDIPPCYGMQDFLPHEEKQRCHRCKAWSLCTVIVVAGRILDKMPTEELTDLMVDGILGDEGRK